MKSIVRFMFVLVGMTLFTHVSYSQANTINARVSQAIAEKGDSLTKALSAYHLSLSNVNILLVAYKHEQEFTVYVKGKVDSNYRFFRKYKICKSSGELGPKRAEGDRQVPEGFYYIDFFNPESDYYLSLGINYPNQSDRIISTAKKLGGDIFIHGDCVTIGCIPLTDEKIKEIYVLASKADSCGQHQIPVYIFPFKFSEPYAETIRETYRNNGELLNFWNDLKTGWELFRSSERQLNVTVDQNGKYLFH